MKELDQEPGVFPGRYICRVDDKGRIKMPAVFQHAIAQHKTWFVTSLDGETVRMYPMYEWRNARRELLDRGPQTDPVLSFALRCGIEDEIDKHGRMLIPPYLRDRFASLSVEVRWCDGYILIAGSQGKNTLNARPARFA